MVIGRNLAEFSINLNLTLETIYKNLSEGSYDSNLAVEIEFLYNS